MSFRFSPIRLALVFGLAFLVSACASDRGELDDLLGTQLGEDIQPVDLGEAVSLDDLKRQMIVNIGDRVFFETGSDKISPRARNALVRQANFLKEHRQIQLTIEGHCDERGTRAYNIGLGLRRANAVRDYLIGAGISASRLKTVSYGRERPVAPCSKERCWKLNRRVVLAIDVEA